MQKLDEINVKTSYFASCRITRRYIKVANRINYPIMVRSAFALGGLGSGISNNEEEFVKLCKSSLSYSKQILVEESLKSGKKLSLK